METTGLNHIIITVSNADQSRAFYRDMLGFETKDSENGFFFESGGIWFFFYPSSKPIAGDRFSEFRIGLDHLAFAATSKELLQQLAEKLRAAGVETNGIETFAPTGNLYVAFRDPDNIQLEYWLPKGK